MKSTVVNPNGSIETINADYVFIQVTEDGKTLVTLTNAETSTNHTIQIIPGEGLEIEK